MIRDMIIGFCFNADCCKYFRHFYVFILYMKIEDFKLKGYSEGYKFVLTIPKGTFFKENKIIRFEDGISIGIGERDFEVDEDQIITVINYSDKLVEYVEENTKESSLISLSTFEYSKKKKNLLRQLRFKMKNTILNIMNMILKKLQ